MLHILPLLKPVELHIPDGFLSIPIALIFWILSLPLILLAVQKSRSELGERQVPLMGIMAAFIFAAQMINFPVAGGTSGHLVGGVLTAVTLGPWAGMLVMTSVIGVQALLFQDGGLLVMGSNIFNMGLLTTMIGYGLYRAVIGKSQTVRLITISMAAWLSVMASALATAIQLWLSGTSPLKIVVPAMLGVHAFIGIGEALITVAAVAFLLRNRPELIESKAHGARGGKGWVIAGLSTALAVVLISPFASANPDGLQRVAEDLGFIGTGINAPYLILPNYMIPFLGETAISTILAGTVGLLVVAGLTVGVFRVIKR